MVDISGINKKVFLESLWENSKPASFFTSSGITPPPIDKGELEDSLKNGKADYLSGRVIKMNFSGDTVDPWGYDRDNGTGSVQKIVDEIRKCL